MQDTPETPGTGGHDPAGGAHVPPPQPAPGSPYGYPGGGAGIGTGPAKGIVGRARDIITQPAREWDLIAAEPATTGPVLTYMLVLAAIGPIAMLIGQQLFGLGFLGYTIRPPLGYSIASALMSYVVSIGGVYLCAFVIDALAPSFNGTKNFPQALKVSAYAATPAWLAGVLYIVPTLAIIAMLAGLYGIYLLYLGLPRLMRSPPDKAIGYTAVVILAYIVIVWVLMMIVAAILASMFMSALTPTIRY